MTVFRQYPYRIFRLAYSSKHLILLTNSTLVLIIKLKYIYITHALIGWKPCLDQATKQGNHEVTE